jgi:hypothetical protein
VRWLADDCAGGAGTDQFTADPFAAGTIAVAHFIGKWLDRTVYILCFMELGPLKVPTGGVKQRNFRQPRRTMPPDQEASDCVESRNKGTW